MFSFYPFSPFPILFLSLCVHVHIPKSKVMVLILVIFCWLQMARRARCAYILEALQKADLPVLESFHNHEAAPTRVHILNTLIKLADRELVYLINWAKHVPGKMMIININYTQGTRKFRAFANDILYQVHLCIIINAKIFKKKVFKILAFFFND